MVDVGVLPPGFVAVDADTLPVPPVDGNPPARQPHPLEAWAEPGPAFEQARRFPLPDTGYVTATVTALQRFAEGEAVGRRYAASLVHPAEQARLQREAEEAAEAERKARDPRAVLAASHRLRVEAQAEADRLATPVERARLLVADLGRRLREHAAAAAAGDEAARTALVEALAAGTEARLPNIVKSAGDDVEHELRTAKAALVELERQARAAADRLARCGHGIARCAIAVLADRAADEANEIIAAEAELQRRRADLDALSRVLTSEGGRLQAQPPRLPPQISRALYPADRVLTGADRNLALTDWRSRYAELCAVPRDDVEAG